MKRVSGGPRRIGGSGMRGISRSSMGSKSSFSRSGSSPFRSSHINTHHSHMYRRHYGNSVIPIEMRAITYVVFGIIILIILFT